MCDCIYSGVSASLANNNRARNQAIFAPLQNFSSALENVLDIF